MTPACSWFSDEPPRTPREVVLRDGSGKWPRDCCGMAPVHNEGSGDKNNSPVTPSPRHQTTAQRKGTRERNSEQEGQNACTKNVRATVKRKPFNSSQHGVPLLLSQNEKPLLCLPRVPQGPVLDPEMPQGHGEPPGRAQLSLHVLWLRNGLVLSS